MAAQFARAPHRGVTSGPTPSAPNAALLIDFDNVTMGIRSDLSKELKNLLNSDIIKGKVAVQRAYADWRRYPQYIVPLAEASVDLIFAPAYGSSKKNATDIRLAIDALELVFTRPEIGTFILLSGDSDFSSLVLKLKEYGKYVIGVGIRESASDLLVQNCDEYYSYSVLSGLTKEDDSTRVALDPWELAEKAVKQMAANGDVMRSDRLKQVMLELDPNFNEKDLGYSKFSKFLSDAVARGCLGMKKGENGQWEVSPVERVAPEAAAEAAPEREARAPREDGRRSRGRGRGRGAAAERSEAAVAERVEPAVETAAPAEAVSPAAPEAEPEPTVAPVAEGDPLTVAYTLLRRAVESVTKGGGPVRDSDVKRRMLELDPAWDESTVGFSKFSRFLRQAHDAEVIDLHKTGNGAYEVTLAGGKPSKESATRAETRGDRGRRGASEAQAASRDAGRVEKASKAEKAEATKEKPAREPGKAARAEKAAAPGAAAAGEPTAEAESPKAEPRGKAQEPATADAAAKPADAATKPAEAPAKPTDVAGTPAAAARRPVGFGIGFRRGTKGPGVLAGPPPLLPGQTVSPRGESVNGKTAAEDAKAAPQAEAEVKAEAPKQPAAAKAETTKKETGAKAKARSSKKEAATPKSKAAEAKESKAAAAPKSKAADAKAAPELVGLPTDAEGVMSYLTTRYKGVGVKTAEALIGAFGADGVFRALHAEPERVRELLGARRTEALLKGWESDLAQRRAEAAAEIEAASKAPASKESKTATKRKSAAKTAEAKASKKSAASKGSGKAEEPKASGKSSSRRGRSSSRKTASKPKVEAGGD